VFDVLMSSQVRRRLHPGRGLLVAALHGVLVAGAVRVAQTAPRQETGPRVDTTAFIIPPLPPALERVQGLASEGGFVPGPIVDLPLPPIELPSFTTPVTVGPGLYPDRIRRALTAGPGAEPAAGDPFSVERILGAAEVDDPAAVVHQPSPRYPPALRLAGIEGRVLVEFVIDTTGHLERGSLRVLEASHAGFEAAAREALERSVFTPARMGGRPVRQRTRQSIGFRIRFD
jgi:periplasmic protein TonB